LLIPWHRQALLRLSVGRSSLRAEAIEHRVVVWAGESSYNDVTELADAIARLAAEPPRTCRRLVVVLERPPVQLRTLGELPPVKPQHLAALVAQQAGRFFRKNGQRLVTDALWVGNGAHRVAHAAAIEEPLVEAIAAGARAAGLWLESIAPADSAAVLTLLPRSERATRERLARRRTVRLASIACVLWLTVGALFFGRLVLERRAVEHELAALAKPLAAVLEARRELRDAETTLNAVTTAERDRGRSLATLAAVTGALPDSSVLTSLTWTADGSAVLVGAAQRATDVVARLDRLDVLAGAHLGGPVVRETIGGRNWERFTILFGRERRAGSREQGGSGS
jgi:Tfp pilus assembly protein PilN